MSIQQNYGNIKPSLNLDFANTKQLDPRITYSRASTGTYYDGMTRAKAEENLLLQSQTFSTGSWSTSNIAFVGNSATAPDGTNTATTITANGSGSLSHYSQSLATTSAGIATASIYVKTSTAQYLQIFFTGDGSSYANFDIVNGTVTASSGTATGSIVSVGNGWYRCIAVNTSTAVTGCGISIVSASTSGRIAAFTAVGTEAVFIWGAQLEQRSTATAYTPTTTAPITNYIPVLQTASAGTPRFDHNPITGESLGLLVEEQRTNLLTYSETFDNAAWAPANTTITANSVVAPNGTQTAENLVPTTNTAQHFVTQNFITSGTTTFSVYAKAAGYVWLGLTGSGNGFTTFNLSSGTVGTVGSGVTASITSVGNGWYRCSVTQTYVGQTNYIFVEPSNAQASFAGNGFSGIYIWGAQLEAGAFATSYIPTVASQVTRAADSASMTGTNFSSWYNQSEGTLFTDAVSNGGTVYAQIGIGSNSDDRVSLYAVSPNFAVVSGSTTSAALGGATLNNGTSSKLAGAYKVNDFAISINGATVLTDTTGSVANPASMLIGARNSASPANQLNGTIKKLAYYPRRLTNTQLQALTS